MRKTTRESAFKLIFERLINGNESELSYNLFTNSLDADDKLYFDRLVGGTKIEQEYLCGVVSSYAKGFSLDRIYKIDLSILLIAAYEILFDESVPDKVAANEAVELAKVYSTDNSPSFINGIIASVIKNKEEILNERNSD